MGLLGLERRDANVQATADGYVADMMRRDRGGWFGRQVGPISADQAMRHSAVWSSSSLISNLISTMDFDGYRQAPKTDEPNTLASLATNTTPPVKISTPPILGNPSDVVDPISWRFAAVMSALIAGMAAGRVTATSGSAATKCELIDAKRVSYTSIDGKWRVDGREVKRWPVGDLWVMPGYTMPGSPVGLSVLKYASSAIGLGLAAEAFGRDTFTDSAHPSGILKFLGGDVDDDQADILKGRWRQKFSGRRDPAIVGKDWDYTPVTIPAEDSQFLMTIQANVATVARFFHMPPELIGASSGTSMTYSNIETRMLSLLMLTLAPWLRRLEAALTTLLPAPETVLADETSLLRTDSATVSIILDRYVRAGIMNRDEPRGKLNLPPIPDGSGQAFNWPPGNTRISADGGDPDPLAPAPDAVPSTVTTTQEGF